jgi:hypothetical protein
MEVIARKNWPQLHETTLMKERGCRARVSQDWMTEESNASSRFLRFAPRHPELVRR